MLDRSVPLAASPGPPGPPPSAGSVAAERSAAALAARLAGPGRLGADLVPVESFVGVSEVALQESFAPAELAYARTRLQPEASLAAAWAAKEAFAKALGLGLGSGWLSPHEVWVEHDGDGRPALAVAPALRERLGLPGQTWPLSLSHAGGLALALVALPATLPLPAAPRPQGKTGGIKNYEKTRADLLTLLEGSPAAEAPPPPLVEAAGPRVEQLRSWAADPALRPVFALAERCGIEPRVVQVHPQAWENLDNAEESNDFRKLAPFAQLHFLCLTLDAASYGRLPAAPPLAPGARGALLVNAGLLEGPDGLADARALLLRSELLHEVVHFEDPSFAPVGDDLRREWLQEAAGLARQVLVLAAAPAALRARAEALVGDSLEGNPVRGSFDLELGDGSHRRIASKTFLVLETELAELQRSFGTLSPDGMNPALFRLIDRFLAEPVLFDAGAGELSDEGLAEVLRYATRQDRDLRKPVQREMGLLLQELVVPEDGPAALRALLGRVEDLLAGRREPAVAQPAPPAVAPPPGAPRAGAEGEGGRGGPVLDPFEVEVLRRSAAPAPPPTPPARWGLLLGGPAPATEQSWLLHCWDLRPPRAQVPRAAAWRAETLARARAWAEGGGRVGLRLSRDLEPALDELRLAVPLLREALVEVLAEVEAPSEVWRLDDELSELEGLLGLRPGGVPLLGVLESVAALGDAGRILRASPRLRGLELGATLPAQLGWIFEPRAHEPPAASLARRALEAEAALAPERARLWTLCQARGKALLRRVSALPPRPAADAALVAALATYDGLRGDAVAALGDLAAALSPSPDSRRLASLEGAVFGQERADPAAELRYEEDLRVLEQAVQRSSLPSEELERYWRARWFALYDPGVPPTLPIPALSLPEALLQAAQAHPDARFLYRAERLGEGGRREPLRAEVPFAELLGPAAWRSARVLQSLGVAAGDRVGLSTSNTLANVAVFQALAWLGAVVVPLDPSKAHLADRFFNDAQVRLLVFDPGFGADDVPLHHARLMAWARDLELDEPEPFLAALRRARRRLGAADGAAALEELQALLPPALRGDLAERWSQVMDPASKFAESLPRVPSLRAVLFCGVEDFVPGLAPAPLPEGAERLRRALPQVTLLQLGPALTGVSAAPLGPPPQPEHLLALPYTGGTTTGVSKAALHTHRSLLALGLQRAVSMIPEPAARPHTVATSLPLTHTYGFATGVLTPVLSGANAVLVPNTGPRYLSTLAECLERDSVSELFSSRSALSSLVRLVPEGVALPALERIASSGDTLTVAVSEAWRSRFGVSPTSGYGSTETPSSLVNPAGHNRPGTEGIPVPNVEARVVDPSSGVALPPGKAGLLQVRGPHLAQGYLGRPDADAKALQPGGWWQKDDIFRMDREGYFVFCGRADDMFTVNELNVYPEAVEQALLSLEPVAEAGVVGVFDEGLATNRVKAFVVLQPGVEVSAESLIEAVKPLLESHECPSLVELVPELAKSNFGKLARFQLRKPEAPEPVASPAPAVPAAPPAPAPLEGARVALTFPTGGSHFPGMGAELALDPEGAELLGRAEAALAELGVPRGALTALMEGPGQAERLRDAAGYSWRGDFPLSVAAQTLLSVALARGFERRFGAPAVVAGESMGEVAAYCASGALELEPALQLAVLQARALAAVSDALGLRMAVVESLAESDLATLRAELDARVVIAEAPGLCVLALPARHLLTLEERAAALGGRALVSNNPCAAHDPRLELDLPPRQAFLDFVRDLPLRPARTPVASVLEPGRLLREPAELRANLVTAFSAPLAWAKTVEALAHPRDLQAILTLGSGSSALALERLQSQGALPAALRLHSLAGVAALEAVDLVPGRSWRSDCGRVEREFLRALATSSGDRNSYHLDPEYARRTRFGAPILHGVGTEGLVLAALAAALPSWELADAELPSFKLPVREGDEVFGLYEVRSQSPSELKLDFAASNGWGDLLLEGSVRLCPRSGAAPQAGPLDLAAYGAQVQPFVARPAPDFVLGQADRYPFLLDEARVAATRQLFPGGDGAFGLCLGLQLLSCASAHFAPGFVLTGTELVDLRRVGGDLERALRRAGVPDAAVRAVLDSASDLDALFDALPAKGRAARALRRGISSAERSLLDELLGDPGERSRLSAGWGELAQPLEPGELLLEVEVEELSGQTPQRSVVIGVRVRSAAGRVLYRGRVRKTEAPSEAAGEGASESEALAAQLVQQKIINVFPVTRPRDAENSAADPAVNAALLDLEDAVSPTLRQAARPRAVDLIARVRRDTPPGKRALVAALQTARARSRPGGLAEALLDPAVRDLSTLLQRLELRKRGAQEVEGLLRKPQQRLLTGYLRSVAWREELLRSVDQLDFSGKVLKLRPNNVRSLDSAADYWEVVRRVGRQVDALTIPKTRDPAELVEIDRVLSAIEEEQGWPVGGLKLEVLIEHPLAVARVDEIAAASPRIISLIYGHVDYVAATGGWDQNYQFEFQHHAKRRTVEAAHRNGQIAIDAITPAIDAELARQDAERSVALGFDGKWSIHLDHIQGISQVSFPPPTLRLRPHAGAAAFAAGRYDLATLEGLAQRGQALVPGPAVPPRWRSADLRAVLRCDPGDLPRLAGAPAAQIQVDLRGVEPSPELLAALRALGPKAAAVVSPSAPPAFLSRLAGVVAAIVLEAEPAGPALAPEAVARAAEAFSEGTLSLSLRRPAEIDQAFALAAASLRVGALIHSLPEGPTWDSAGALVAAAWALGIDPLLGVDAAEGWQRRAFRHAHMGLRGQVCRDPGQLEGLRAAYTPRADLIAEAAAVVERYYRAERIEDLGAIPYEFTYLLERPTRGLVDAATAKIFDVVLQRAAELDLLEPAQREIWRSYTLRWRFNDSGEEVDFTRWRFVPGAPEWIERRDDPQQRHPLGPGPGAVSPQRRD